MNTGGGKIKQESGRMQEVIDNGGHKTETEGANKKCKERRGGCGKGEQGRTEKNRWRDRREMKDRNMVKSKRLKKQDGARRRDVQRR